jgi:hypothetical protein
MPAAPKLDEFVLEETDDGYLLTVAAEGGQKVTVQVEPEQLDAIIEALDDLLTDEDELEVDDD